MRHCSRHGERDQAGVTPETTSAGSLGMGNAQKKERRPGLPWSALSLSLLPAERRQSHAGPALAGDASTNLIVFRCSVAGCDRAADWPCSP